MDDLPIAVALATQLAWSDVETDLEKPEAREELELDLTFEDGSTHLYELAQYDG